MVLHVKIVKRGVFYMGDKDVFTCKSSKMSVFIWEIRVFLPGKVAKLVFFIWEISDKMSCFATDKLDTGGLEKGQKGYFMCKKGGVFLVGVIRGVSFWTPQFSTTRISLGL